MGDLIGLFFEILFIGSFLVICSLILICCVMVNGIHKKR